MMRKLRWIVIVGTMAAAGLNASCSSDSYNTGDESASAALAAAAGRPECPHDWTRIKGGPISIPLSGDIINIPELHDCQRFIEGDPEKRTAHYRPMYAIFAAAWLDTLTRVIGAREGTSAIKSIHAASAATIYSYDSVPYEPLGIPPGFSCLVVYADGQWKARLVPATTPDKCLDITDPSTVSGHLLAVREVRLDGRKEEDYPPVARWDWDSGNHEHYIGIKCGAAWCEIGRAHNYVVISKLISRVFAKFKPSEVYAFRQQAPRTLAIKGWYDEQYLAVESSNGVLVPGRTKGTFIPETDLAEWSSRDSADIGEWRKVATMGTDGPPGIYRQKLQMTPRRPVSSTAAGMPRFVFETEVFLCRGRKGDCDVPSDIDGPTSSVDWVNDPWWARLDAPGSRQYRPVIRRRHPGFKIPATVRWRWRPNDETGWIACPEGCCEIMQD